MRLIAAITCLCVLLILCFNILHAYSKESLKEAQYYSELNNKAAQCQLCPRRCVIPPGKRGFCGVRENIQGTLYTLVYGKSVAIHIDPIEKKPFFHFLPSTTAYSIATAGCNLKCKFCQNWEISQVRPEEIDYFYLTPDDVISQLKESGARTIAYTYSEPTIFYEYMLETAKLARKAGF
jgi:pyruvate formate lyase activating enzyme